ncbi:MAG: DUF4149 domain-containing protein [Chitinophagaceae bacterium]|nr:MAG: DUF4149 domain-containing protein [Chitinophagaceae bacterium]
MLTIYKLSVLIHVLSAMFWLGGMLFTVFVLVPTIKNKTLATHKGLFFSIMGKRFSNISWLLFAILLSTGLIQLWARGYSYEQISSIAFWQTSFGHALANKLIVFSIMLLISAVHDFWLGPKASQLMETHPNDKRTQKFRKSTSWMGRLNLLLGIIILYYAVSLVRS